MAGFRNFLEGPANENLDATSPFSQFLDGEDEANGIKRSLTVVDSAGLNPDQAAEAKALAAKTGIPRVAVEATLPDVKKHAERLDLIEAAKTRPEIARLLLDPNVAKIARDDVGPLAAVSDAFKFGLAQPAQNFGQTLEVLGFSDTGRQLQDISASKDYQSAAEAFINPKPDQFSVFGFAPQHIPLAAVEQSGQILGSILTRILGAAAGGAAGGAVGSVVPVLGTAAGATGGAITGSFAGPFLFEAAQIVGPVAKDRAKRNGYETPTSEDLAYAWTTAASTGALNALGAKYLPGGEGAVGSVTKRIVTAFFGEGVTEGAQSVAQQLGATAQTKGGIEVDPKQAIGEAILGGTSAGGMSAGFEGGRQVVRRTSEMVQRAQAADQAKAQAAALDQVVAAATATKTLQRDPETFKQFMDTVASRTGIDTVYVPAEALAEYFQTADNLPPGIDRDDFEIAQAMGTDVAIPISDYVADIGPQHHAGLRQHIRLSEDTWTEAEADEYFASVDEIEEQANAEIAERMDRARAEAEPADRVFEHARDQYVGVYTPDVAAKNAILDKAFAQTMASRARGALGDAWQVYERARPLKVENEFNRSLIKPTDDLDLDLANLKAIQDGRRATPMLDILRARGGVDPKSPLAGELRVMGVTAKTHPGLFKRGGRGAADNIVISEHPILSANGFRDDGNGYADQNAVLETISEELAGKPLRDATAAEREAYLAQLDQYLGELGLSANDDPAKIKEAIRKDQERRAASADDELEQRDTDGKRGSYSPSENVTRFFQARDLSTGLHEAGHRWLEAFGDIVAISQERLENAELDDAQAAGLQDIVNDYNAILQHLGVSSREEIGTKQHEEFARTVEAYLMTGKAPSIELQSAFQRFADWLLNIYKDIKAFSSRYGVRLNPEITSVLDRMLATREEIEDAERAARFDVLNIPGVSPALQQTLNKAGERATGEAERRLLVKAMAPIRRERERWWKEEHRRVSDRVQEELQRQPVWRAMAAIRGTEGVDPIKLDFKALETDFGSGVRDVLPRGATAKRNGIEPNIFAEQFGFPDARALVDALSSIKDVRLKDVVEREATQRMHVEHGDILNDGSIEAEARDAIHNEERAKALALEVKLLRQAGVDAKRAGEQRVLAEGALDPQSYASEAAVAETGVERLVAQEAARAARFARAYDRVGRQQLNAAMADINPKAIRQAARNVVGRMKTKDLGKVAQYSRASLKAAEEARAAVAKRDYERAAFYKYRQLLNHFLYIETKAAQKENESIVKYLSRLADKKTIPEMDQEYLEQIHGLLEKYDLKRASQVEVERRKSFAAWAAEQEAAGREVIAPPELRELAGKQHYSGASLDEMRTLRDTVEQVEHFGRLKQKLLDLQEARDFNEMVDEAVAQVEGLNEEIKERVSVQKTRWDSFKEGVRSIDASLLKIEQICDWLDGGNPNGIFNRVVFRRMAEAEHRGNDMALKYAIGMEKITERLDKTRMQESIHVPGIVTKQGTPKRWTRSEIMAVALNLGNEENRFRVTARRGNNLSQAQINELTSYLNAQEAQAVQEIWEHIDSLWPEIADLEKRVNGVAPPKVEATPFTMQTQDGPVEMKGGYYPIVYDPEKSDAAAKQEEKKSSALYENNYQRAYTQRGHTKERVAGVARPVRLDINVIPNHLAQVTHDIAFREAVQDVDRFTQNARVKGAIRDALGAEIASQFRPWLQAIANDRNGNPMQADKWEKLARTARTNATMVGLGFRITTMLAQVSGISASAEMIGPKWVGVGMKEFYGSPADIRKTIDIVIAKSGEMRHRHNQLDRDIRDGMRTLAKNNALDDIRRFGFMGISIMDKGVSMPTWLGAYHKGLSEGMTEDEAIAYGDKVVRLTQGAGGAKDLAAVQRGSEFKKWLTMFYSYFNVLYNRQRDIGRSARRGGDFSTILARTFFLVAVPAVLSELLTGKGPEEDEDELLWAARKVALYPFMSVPIARDVLGSLDSGFGYQLSPMARSIGNISRLAYDVKDIAEGEADPQKVAKDALNVAGFIFGLPVGQVATTGGYLWDVMDGDEDPEGVLDFARGAAFGPPKK